MTKCVGIISIPHRGSVYSSSILTGLVFVYFAYIQILKQRLARRKGHYQTLKKQYMFLEHLLECWHFSFSYWYCSWSSSSLYVTDKGVRTLRVWIVVILTWRSDYFLWLLAKILHVFKCACLLINAIENVVNAVITCTGKVSSTDDRSSRGYYANEGLGPAMTSTNIDIDAQSDRSYATVSTNQRLANTVNHVAHNILSECSSNSTTASTSASDVPRSSLRPNIAYGLEQKRNERKIVNGIKAPMRPPPRPPR